MLSHDHEEKRWRQRSKKVERVQSMLELVVTQAQMKGKEANAEKRRNM